MCLFCEYCSLFSLHCKFTLNIPDAPVIFPLFSLRCAKKGNAGRPTCLFRARGYGRVTCARVTCGGGFGVSCGSLCVGACAGRVVGCQVAACVQPGLDGQRSRMRWRLQPHALAIAAACVGNRGRMRWRLQPHALAIAAACVGNRGGMRGNRRPGVRCRTPGRQPPPGAICLPGLPCSPARREQAGRGGMPSVPPPLVEGGEPLPYSTSTSRPPFTCAPRRNSSTGMRLLPASCSSSRYR